MTSGTGQDGWGTYETRTEALPGPASSTATWPGAESAPEPTLVGQSRPRTDSAPRVLGTLRFAADEPAVPGMLHARLVLSIYAHARIDGIDTSAALEVPGVVAVITERLSDGRISFMLTREFELEGKTKRTTYLNTRHLPAVRRLLADLEERLELIEDRIRERRRERPVEKTK